MEEDTRKTLSKVVQIDERRLQDHLGELVRGTVEETLNAMLDAEADALCGAQRYERSPERTDYRAGSYGRKLHTRAGEVTLKMPKLRRQPDNKPLILVRIFPPQLMVEMSAVQIDIQLPRATQSRQHVNESR